MGNYTYRGQSASPIRFRVSFVQIGNTMVELIQRASDGPDALNDMFAAGSRGLHHMSTFCDDYDAAKAELTASGYPVASECTTPWGTKIAFVDTRPLLGHMIELYPQDEGLHDLYSSVRAAAETWDGRTLSVPWR